jgi:MPBQ/MSBQ methyltransferase
MAGPLVEAVKARLPSLSPADLAAIDEFHVRGRAATLELAASLAPAPDSVVLDIGSGLGGPSRVLRRDHGCRVVGIDLSEEYCRVARLLSEWVGLGAGIAYCRADALALPVADRSFDAAWTQHAAMSIADKPLLYAEARRALKEGGKFALYDAVQGTGGSPHFPVPWARTAEASHLVTPEELRRLLAAAGFVIERWRDTTLEARGWFAEVERRQRAKGPPALNLGLVLGADFPAMAQNLRRNLEEGRVALVDAICRRR